jgi:SAM-dependent MidA family methyltransferase
VSLSPGELPIPERDETERSAKLRARIATRCADAGGEVSFAEYMQMALYEPGLGYYSGGLRKFGAQGDFITAPEISPLFSQCLALQIIETVAGMDNFTVLEFGAGSGVMAADILLELERQASLPDAYLVMELSAELRTRQCEMIQSRAPHLLARVQWLDRLPEKFCGIVLANEVLDAMPVECFRRSVGSVEQMVVGCEKGGLYHDYRRADAELMQALADIEERRGSRLAAGYCSELNLNIRPWIAALFDCIARGVVLLIDYGYGVKEYYLDERTRGTLMCHYRQRAHPDPFWYPGIQDITCYVDFSAVAHAAVDTGFELLGYTTQASFLLGGGLADLYQQQVTDDVKTQVKLAQQIKTLTLPAQMGERFKVMGLAKNILPAAGGFMLQDHRNKL